MGHKVLASIYCEIDGMDKLIEKVALNNQKVNTSSVLLNIAKRLREANLYRQDCLFDKYGGSLFKGRKNRLRLLIDHKMLFLDPSLLLVYKKTGQME